MKIFDNFVTKNISACKNHLMLDKLGIKADSPYKCTRVVTRQVLTGLTCMSPGVFVFNLPPTAKVIVRWGHS